MVRALILALAAAVGLCGAPLWAQDVVLGQTYGQGVHAFFAGDYLEAHRLFTAAIEAGSKDPRVYYYRGLCLMNLQRPEQAPGDFKRGAELESSEEGRIYNVGRALERVQGRARLEVEKYRVQARMARLAEERRLQQLRFGQLGGQQPGVAAQPGQTRPDLPVEPLPKPVEPGDTDPFSAPKTTPSQPGQTTPPAEKPVESPAEPKPPATEPQPSEPKPPEPPSMPEQPPAQPQPPSEPAGPKVEPAPPGATDPFEPATVPQPPQPPQAQPGQTEPAMPAQPGAEPGVSPPSAGGKSVLGALRRAIIKGAAGGELGEGDAPKPQPAPPSPPGIPGQVVPVPPPPAQENQEPTPPAPKAEEPTPPAPPQPPTPPPADDDPFSVPAPSKPTGPMKPAVEDPFSLEPPAAKTKPSAGKPAPRREPPADPFN